MLIQGRFRAILTRTIWLFLWIVGTLSWCPIYRCLTPLQEPGTFSLVVGLWWGSYEGGRTAILSQVRSRNRSLLLSSRFCNGIGLSKGTWQLLYIHIYIYTHIYTPLGMLIQCLLLKSPHIDIGASSRSANVRVLTPSRSKLFCGCTSLRLVPRTPVADLTGALDGHFDSLADFKDTLNSSSDVNPLA